MKFLTQEQFTEMWKLQDELNTATSGPDWTKRGQNWNLAIKDEIMEFYSYIGYKWWKTPDQTKSVKDMQARLELVDIWHFLLSKIIEVCTKDDITIQLTFDQIVSDTRNAEPDIKYLERVDHGNCSLLERVWYLSSSILACDWTWDELYKAYIGKVALNNFRQANGYKEGTYVKCWGVDPEDKEFPLEDNYFLECIMQELSLTEGALTYQAVYAKLGIEYMLRT